MRRLLALILGAAAVAALLGTAPAAEPEARGDDAAAGLVLELDEDGGLAISGAAPEGLGRAALSAIFPGARIDSKLRTGVGGDPAAWRAALDALHVALPRIESARIVVCDRRISVAGRIREGFALRETRPALRAALGSDWALEIALEEARVPSALAFALEGGAVWLTGILPHGLAVRQAMATIGVPADGPVTTGGAGDSARWSHALGVLGRLASVYESGAGRITPQGFEVDGRLAPGQRRDEVADWLGGALGEGFAVRVTGEEREAEPGARRTAPLTGETERLIAGRWLPQFDFAPSPDECTLRTAAAQRGRPLGFLSGQSVLDAGAEVVLDRLAGIALACLRRFGMRLEIGGHTDSQGDPEENRALGQARAEAIRAALVARAVPAAAMRAIGFGDAEPVASNETEDGRRRNRRISLVWTEG
jgi:OmpA-OmpF porin, OOP family